VLDRVSRPLGLVAKNANLNDWDALQGVGRVDLLMAALNMGNVIIEYYKIEGDPILSARAGWAGWAMHNE
jgi:hypothetical protein